MNNQEFQQTVLNELRVINTKIANIETSQDEMKNNIYNKIANLEIRQNEIYNIVRSIEHSNSVGRAELDSHNFRIAKNEGKFKKIVKVLTEDDNIANVSNL